MSAGRPVASGKPYAVRYSLLQVLIAVSLGSLCLIPGIFPWLRVVLAVTAILCLVSILPLAWALRIRFREIEGGELDAAGQY